jgi:hypothetical protein
VFLQLSSIGLFEKNEPFPTLKTTFSTKYSFQKLTQFSQGDNVLDAADSNVDGFLWRDVCVSSTQLNRPNGANRVYNHLGTPKFPEVFHSKTNSIFTGNNVLDALASNTDGFLSRGTCVSTP